MDLLNLKKSDPYDEEDEDDDGRYEGSIKGLWKRAFNSLKIRDKIKSPKKKKGSRNEEEDIDPVYYLLKHASDKGMQKCPTCTQQSSMPGACGGSPGVSASTVAAAASSSSSFSSGTSCQCACHKGAVASAAAAIPNITLNDLKPQPSQPPSVDETGASGSGKGRVVKAKAKQH